MSLIIQQCMTCNKFDSCDYDDIKNSCAPHCMSYKGDKKKLFRLICECRKIIENLDIESIENTIKNTKMIEIDRDTDLDNVVHTLKKHGYNCVQESDKDKDESLKEVSELARKVTENFRICFEEAASVMSRIVKIIRNNEDD